MSKILSNIIILPVYALFLYTWLLAGFGKLLGPGVPEFFTKTFGGTFLASFPGLTFAFYQIAACELMAGALFLVSFVRGEFLDQKEKPLLRWGLWMSLFNFAVLGFGMRLVQNFDEAGKLFYYFGAVAVVWLFVELVAKPSSRT